MVNATWSTGPEHIPSWHELTAEVHVVSLRLRRRFRGVEHREAVLLRGPAGWAEFSPFVEYDTAECVAWLAATLDVGWCGYPTAVRERIPVNATVPAVPADDVPAVLDRFPGARTAKVKVAEPGQTLADDIARVQETRRYLGDEGFIRLDANGGWDISQALVAISRLASVGLEYVEQPVMDVMDLTEVTHRQRDAHGVKIAADESIRKSDDPLRIIDLDAADVAIVKMPPLGGPQRLIAISNQLHAAGIESVMSSALDTGVGIAAGVATAAAIPHLSRANGLGTSRLFHDSITTDLPISDGYIDVPTTPVVPDTALMTEFAATPDRHDWWLTRLKTVYDAAIAEWATG